MGGVFLEGEAQTKQEPSVFSGEFALSPCGATRKATGG
jgi:hypothetical protein